MDETFQHARLRQPFEMIAGLGETDASHAYRADLKNLPDEIVERYTAREQIASCLRRVQLDAVLSFEQTQHLARDQRHLAAAPGIFRETAFAAEIPIAFKTLAGHGTDLGH